MGVIEQTGQYIERRRLPNRDVIEDVASHVYSRLDAGKAIVIAEESDKILPEISQKLAELCRASQQEYAEVCDPKRLGELSIQIAAAQGLRPAAGLPIDFPSARLFIMKPSEFDGLLPYFATLYVTCSISSDLFEKISLCMTEQSMIVIYE